MTAGLSRIRNAWPIALYLVLCPTMLWLGNWQLDKSRQRAIALAEYETRLEDKTVIDAQDVTDPVRFSPVVAEGVFIAGRQILIDNIVREGRGGCYVIAPLQLRDGRVLLVNRGWVALDARRQPIGELTLPVGAQTITGRIGALPSGGLKLGDNPTVVSDWPPLLVFPTMEEVSTLLDTELIDWVLLAEQTQSSIDTFEREWSPGGLPPERHMGYAVQWFAMAIALTLLMGFAIWRSKGKQPRE